ncbi:unnamed protein product [Arctogadus glacialis]
MNRGGVEWLCLWTYHLALENTDLSLEPLCGLTGCCYASPFESWLTVTAGSEFRLPRRQEFGSGRAECGHIAGLPAAAVGDGTIPRPGGERTQEGFNMTPRTYKQQRTLSCVSSRRVFATLGSPRGGRQAGSPPVPPLRLVPLTA